MLRNVKVLIPATALTLFVLAVAGTTAFAHGYGHWWGEHGGPVVCHRTGNGDYHEIDPNEHSYPAHIRHGDYFGGGTDMGGGTDIGCGPSEGHHSRNWEMFFSNWHNWINVHIFDWGS